MQSTISRSISLNLNGSKHTIINHDTTANVGDILNYVDPVHLVGSTGLGETKIVYGERELNLSKSWEDEANAVPATGATVAVVPTYTIVPVPKPPKAVPIDGDSKDASYIDKNFGANAFAAGVRAIRVDGKWQVYAPMLRGSAFIGLGKAKSAMKLRRRASPPSLAGARRLSFACACRKCWTKGAKDATNGKCLRGKPDCPARA